MRHQNDAIETYFFTICSTVSIVNFEHVIGEHWDWACLVLIILITCCKSELLSNRKKKHTMQYNCFK